MQKNLALGRLGSLASLISLVGLVNRRSSRCLLGLQKKLSLRRTQGTRAIKRLCLNPSTLVALLFGEGHCTALSADFLVVLALSPLPNKENSSNRK